MPTSGSWQEKMDKRVDKNKANERWDKLIDKTFDEVIKPNSTQLSKLLDVATDRLKPGEGPPQQVFDRRQTMAQAPAADMEPPSMDCQHENPDGSVCGNKIMINGTPPFVRCSKCGTTWKLEKKAAPPPQAPASGPTMTTMPRVETTESPTP